MVLDGILWLKVIHIIDWWMFELAVDIIDFDRIEFSRINFNKIEISIIDLCLDTFTKK